MLKQSADARFVKGRSTGYIGIAGTDDPTTLGLEIGGTQYRSPSFEQRGGIKGLLGTGDSDLFGGLDLGVRLQSPSRLAPFIGLGTYLGISAFPHNAEDDNLDNDDDGSIDELGETRRHVFFAVYPELGAHFWLKHDVRATLSAQYHMSTSGSDYNYWFFGLTFAGLSQPSNHEPPAKRPEQEEAPNAGSVESDPRFLEGLEIADEPAHSEDSSALRIAYDETASTSPELVPPIEPDPPAALPTEEESQTKSQPESQAESQAESQPESQPESAAIPADDARLSNDQLFRSEE